MPTTLPSMSLVLPTRGASGSGHWADTLDQNLTAIDGHTHEPGSGARVPAAGINIDADLTFNSSWAAIALNRVSFSTISAPPATTKSLFVFSDELYWKSAAGTSVKITDASSLNVVAFSGGIGGDYSTVSANVSYDDANKQYTFKQGGGVNWAKLRAGALRISEFNTSEALYMEQLVAAALAGNYSVTWPAALPAAGTMIQVDNLGAMSFSNALPADQSITLSGTGTYKHGTKTLVISYASVAGSGGTMSAATGTPFTGTVFQAVNLPIGARVLAIRAYVRDNSTGTTKVQFTFQSLSNVATQTTIATSPQTTGAGTDQTISVTGLTTTIATSNAYTIVMAPTGAQTCRWYLTEVDYDQP